MADGSEQCSMDRIVDGCEYASDTGRTDMIIDMHRLL